MKSTDAYVGLQLSSLQPTCLVLQLFSSFFTVHEQQHRPTDWCVDRDSNEPEQYSGNEYFWFYSHGEKLKSIFHLLSMTLNNRMPHYRVALY